MKITDFRECHVSEAESLAMACYNGERQYVPQLPETGAVPDLRPFAENRLGVAAFEDGVMTGFLCCVEPFDNAFRSTDARGVFCPMGAHAAIAGGRDKIYAAMYQAAAEKWVGAEAVSHALCLYAHDEVLQRQFFRYGFGMRCMDAIRTTEPIDCSFCEGYELYEAEEKDRPLIYPLYLALYEHYRSSPFFMDRAPETEEEFAASFKDGRFFLASRDGKTCAFLKIGGSGETFAAEGDDYRHILGAYCLPEHRGRGLYQCLLNCAIAALRADGVARLGVDFESINPAGSGFWLKYFTPYTASVVRRIDERITRVYRRQRSE